MTDPRKKKLDWLADHRAPADATRTKPLPNMRDRSVGPVTRGNIPLPEASPSPTREASAMGWLADFLPVDSELRGIQAGHELAQQGHPHLGAAVAAVSVLPGASKLAKSFGKKAARVFEHYSAADLSKGVLDPRFMGTGKPGRERMRPDRLPMMHVYAQGARPEPQFKNLPKYQVHVTGDIYDIATDPAGIAKKAKNADAMERAIQKAGYAGYHNSEHYPEIVKLYGKQSVTPAGVPKEYAILTAENANGRPMSAAENKTRNAQLADELRKRGLKFTKVKGAYTDETSGKPLHENSFLVHGIDPEAATALGRQFQQNGVVTHEGYHDLANSKFFPSSGVALTNEMPYTQLPNGTRIQSKIDWNHPKGRVARDSVADAGLSSAIWKYLRDNPQHESHSRAERAHWQEVEGNFRNEYHSDRVLGKGQRIATDSIPSAGRRGFSHLAGIISEENLFSHERMAREANKTRMPVHLLEGPGTLDGPTDDPIRYLRYGPLRSPSDDRSKILRTVEPGAQVYKQTEKPVRASWLTKPDTIVAAPAIRAAGKVFDESKLGPTLPPGFTAERPPVRYPTARADLSMLGDIDSRVKNIFTPNAEKALAEDPRAGGWYDTSQLRDAFANESPSGVADFQQFMKFMGPTSTGTTVPMNIRHASKFYELWKNGQLNLDDLKNGTLSVPYGYANRRQTSVNSGIAKILETGNLDPIAQPKTYRYSNQLAGNAWGGTALDMHVGRQIGKQGMLEMPNGELERAVGFPEPSYNDTRRVNSSPPNSHYPVIEDAMVQEANRLGLPPAVYQALGWIGGAKNTNVSDARTMTELLNEILKNTAAKYNVGTPTDALKGFIAGANPLWD